MTAPGRAILGKGASQAASEPKSQLNVNAAEFVPQGYQLEPVIYQVFLWNR